MAKIDLRGKKFGRLTVISVFGKTKSFNTIWLCKCDCGKEVTVINTNLTRGNSKSCGCVNIEKICERNTTHGMTGTPLYKVWVSMRNRCNTKSCSTYKYYGGRGIKICNEWQEFNNFYNWALKNGFKEELTLDRKNNNGNYEPSNCRWVTQLMQSNNKRNNRYLTINGMTASLADICRLYNAKYKLVWKRLKAGWTLEKALLV
jgi:hypothetical protein